MSLQVNPEWEKAKFALCYMSGEKVVPFGDEIRFNEEPPGNLKTLHEIISFAVNYSIPKYIET